MLKPKKNITQKEIQRDPFLETVDKAQAHFEHNKSLYTQIAIGVVVVVVGLTVLSNKRKTHNVNADISLGQSLVALDQKDLENAKFQLETVIDTYDGTKSANDAKYFLGKLYYDEGDVDKAQSLISSYYSKSSNEMMLASSAHLLANIALKQNKITDALSILKKTGKKVKLQSQKNDITLAEAKILILNGDNEKARLKIDHILKTEDIPNNQKQTAEELLGKIAS